MKDRAEAGWSAHDIVAGKMTRKSPETTQATTGRAQGGAEEEGEAVRQGAAVIRTYQKMMYVETIRSEIPPSNNNSA
jgi:hypothetical protein